jgi:hypothetical protein
MIELDDLYELLQSAARSVGAEVTSPWFYLQLGLILAGAGIAFGVGAAVRSRVDMTSLAMGWPAPLRLFMRVLVGSAPTAAFAVLMIAARGVMLASTARGLRQAGDRLADHPPRHQRDPQRIRGPRGVAGGVAGRGAEHYRSA